MILDKEAIKSMLNMEKIKASSAILEVEDLPDINLEIPASF
jgi:hypothetical protein